MAEKGKITLCLESQPPIQNIYERDNMNQSMEVKDLQCLKPSSSRRKTNNHPRREGVNRSRSRTKAKKTGDTLKVMESQSMFQTAESPIPMITPTMEPMMELPLELTSILDSLCPLEQTLASSTTNVVSTVPTTLMTPTSPLSTFPNRLTTTTPVKIPCEAVTNPIHFCFDSNVYLGDLFDSIIAPTFTEQNQTIRSLHLQFYRKLVIDATVQIISQREVYPNPEQYLSTFIAVLTNVGLLTSLS